MDEPEIPKLPRAGEVEQSTEWVEPLAYADRLEDLIDEDTGQFPGSPANAELADDQEDDGA